LQTQFFFGRPGTKGFLGHQDNYSVDTDPVTFTSVWLALTDVSVDNGCLQANLGSHKFGLLPVVDVQNDRDFGQDINARKFFAVPPIGCETVTDVEVKRGTAVLIHPEVIHSSRDNTSNRFRYALLTTWIKQGAKYRPGNTAKRQHIDIS
jgi:ectoine hydroxylase-related dioxygenase (phytanoyl-CoA dioxygenase family)